MITVERFETWLSRLGGGYYGGLTRLDPSMIESTNDLDLIQQRVDESRLRFLEEIGAAPTRVRTMAQHGTVTWVVGQEQPVLPNAQVEYPGDGLITNLRDVTLLEFSADCPPIWLTDRLHRAWGLLHAGWRGTMQNIVGRALAKLDQNFGIKPEELVAYIGPGICAEHYPRGNDWRDWMLFDLLHQESGIEATHHVKGDKVHWDVVETNIALLLRYGVRRISRSDECTYEVPTLASARRNGPHIPNGLAIFGRRQQ